MKLKDKVAIITGATSGMGRASAYLFAKEGAKVFIVGRSEERAKEVVENIQAQGGEATYLIADLTKADAAKEIVDRALEAYGTVDILFNNAGLLNTTPLREITLEEWNEVFQVNLTTPLQLAQLVAPIMEEKGKGVIINTSSVAGRAAHHGFVGYVSSKHALNGLTKSMAWEYGPKIRANAILPGAIATAMLDSFGGEAVMGPMIERTPLKRIGRDEEIAKVALFLASDDSSFMTGQLVAVDGGVDI